MPKKSRQRRAFEAKRKREGTAPAAEVAPTSSAPSLEPVVKAKASPERARATTAIPAPFVSREIVRISILGAIMLAILLILSRLL